MFGHNAPSIALFRRFGFDAWLQPYTDKTIEQLAKDGVKRIAVVTPGFSADCLETLEEIAQEGPFRTMSTRDATYLAGETDHGPGSRPYQRTSSLPSMPLNCFIILRSCAYCLSRRFTSCTLVPLPRAMR